MILVVQTSAGQKGFDGFGSRTLFFIGVMKPQPALVTALSP